MSGSPASSSRRKPGAGSWCRPSPAPPAPRPMSPQDAFERIAKAMIDGIAAAGPLDAVYLDLHGAMVTEHLDDGEGEILARVREVIGTDLPLVASLDLHANVTPRDGRACGRADRLPHLSACRHGRHRPRGGQASGAAARTNAQIRQGVPAIAVPDPDLLAMHRRPAHQGHLPEARGAARATRCRRCRSRRDFRPPISLDCGPSVFAYGQTQADADAAADAIAALVESHEDDFDGRIYTPDEGVRTAMELATTRQQAGRHRRHPGQSRRRRRFRHHRHAARAGPQQRRARRDRRDL